MLGRYLVASVAFCLLAFPNHEAAAFDGNRSGFELGFAMGYGTLYGPYSGWDVQGLETELRIGCGVSEQWAIQYRGKQIWVQNRDAFLTIAYPTLGVTYYLKPKAPSLFILGSVGGGAGAALGDGEGGGALLGPVGFVGIGYEPLSHVALELAIGSTRSGPGGVSLTNAAVTLHLLGY
jgi:hypothetical protein